MKNCVFCDMVENIQSISERIIFSDDQYIGIRVMHPESDGHFILFPKLHYSQMSEMNEKGQFFESVVKLAESQMEKLHADAYVLKLNNMVYLLENDPMHVGHIHMHVIPRYKVEEGVIE